jgi:hypothetical protein
VFLAMLPTITRYAKIAFRNLDPEARQEAVQNVLANSCAAVAALARRGKLDLCYPTVLARFGIQQTRDHRITGGKLNIRDVSHPYCQTRKNVKVERLDRYDEQEQAWTEAIVEDKTAGPADIARTRIDFADWLASLKRRDRKIAESLAAGNRTGEVAKRYRVSAGRISQLRQELARDWHKFVGDDPEPAVA